jgi:hypothetical protein
VIPEQTKKREKKGTGPFFLVSLRAQRGSSFKKEPAPFFQQKETN